VSFYRSWVLLTASFKKPQSSSSFLKERTVQPGDAYEDAACKPGIWNGEILNQVVESRLFTSALWNRCLHWLSDVELIRKSNFSLHLPELTTVSLLESESGFEVVTQPADTEKRPSSHVYIDEGNRRPPLIQHNNKTQMRNRIYLNNFSAKKSLMSDLAF
jgi:hypothetical protein